jgi:hypothetical protein
MTPALPGDLAPRDVIALPGEEGEVVVEAIHLGRGGFPLTVSALHAAAGDQARVVTLTADTRVPRRWGGEKAASPAASSQPGVAGAGPKPAAVNPAVTRQKRCRGASSRFAPTSQAFGGHAGAGG